MPDVTRTSAGEPMAITPELVRAWPLPRPDGPTASARGKESRGSVLIAGGSTEIPGALILAGIAALRAGAGKLQLATCREAALALAVAVPEARVLGLPQATRGDIAPTAAERLGAAIAAVPAALLGPGMLDIPTVQELLRRVLPAVQETALVLDAGALAAVSADRGVVHHLGGNVVLTPHLTELALMLGIDEEEVTDDPLGVARRAAAEARAVVALKGARTYVATPDGTAYCYAEGSIGLATSGSGDTLAGVIAGLLAHGTEPTQATVWGVYLHGSAGQALSARLGTLGFLARELLAEIPPLMAHREAHDAPLPIAVAGPGNQSAPGDH